MSKHTPGPWRMYASGYENPKHEEFAIRYWVGAGETDHKGPGTICGDVNPTYSGMSETLKERLSEQKANATLIAAAPEMLDALNEVLHRYTQRQPYDHNLLLKLEAVISKAKDES